MFSTADLIVLALALVATIALIVRVAVRYKRDPAHTAARMAVAWDDARNGLTSLLKFFAFLAIVVSVVAVCWAFPTLMAYVGVFIGLAIMMAALAEAENRD